MISLASRNSLTIIEVGVASIVGVVAVVIIKDVRILVVAVDVAPKPLKSEVSKLC